MVLVSRRRIAGCLAAGALALSAAAPALADPPPACPDAPADYSGSDDTVAELRALRADLRAACLAETGRQDQGSDRAHSDATDTKASVDAVAGKLDAPVDVHVTNPTDAPATQTVHLSDADQGWLNGNVDVLKNVLWVLVGTIIGLVVVPPIIRLVKP